MRSTPFTTLLFSLATMFAVAAHAQAPIKEQDSILVDEAGMTLYIFDQDKANSGKSVCNDGCAKNWPPVQASPDAKAEGDYTLIERDDGSKQWAYRGMPLYTFVKDTKPGDRSGDNVRGVWHVVNP